MVTENYTDEDDGPHDIAREMILGFLNSPENAEFVTNPNFRTRLIFLVHNVVTKIKLAK